MINLQTSASADTKEIARRLADHLCKGDIILISGDLGAGKTTFTQGLGAALGVEEPITSPTFVLVRSYRGRLALHHADVYRLDQLQEVVDLGLGELIDGDGVAVVEWGELAAPALPADVLRIRIEFGDGDDDRRIEIEGAGETWAQRDGAVRASLTDWMAS